MALEMPKDKRPHIGMWGKPGWRKRGTRTGLRWATGCSIRAVQSGTVNEHAQHKRLRT
jgi:hypothetical protein